MACTPLLLLVVAGCTTYAPAPAPRPPPCQPVTIRVVDEAARPVAGASVRTLATYRRYGPSGLPETSHLESEESPVVKTDARGNAVVCQARSDGSGSTIVTHLDWPEARVFPHIREVTIGPARTAVVHAPLASPCDRDGGARVTAYAEPAIKGVRGTPGPMHHHTLSGLGPWRYWVRSEACGESVVRSLDGRTLPAVLTMDRSDAVVEYPTFAGGTLRVSSFHDPAPLATATLPADGVATLPLLGPPGTAYCLMLETHDRCLVTYMRAGEVARPGMYLDRGASLAHDCPACPQRDESTAPAL